MFYVTVILAASFLIVFSHFFVLPFSLATLGSLSLSVALGVVAVIAADGIGALLIRRLTPCSWYAPGRALFTVSRREYRFYRALGVPRWKGLVPELGLFTGFSKSDFEGKADAAYLARFLTENNYGALIHVQNALCGFVISFIPLCSAPSVWIPIALVNAALSLMPVAVLRYTSHLLLRLYEREKKSKEVVLHTS